MNQKHDTSDRKREESLSRDGKWRSFPRVPHLLQYVSNGNYYGRIKLNGKTIRESLETTVWTTAKLRLADFLKERMEGRNKTTPPLFSEAVVLFKHDLESDTGIKPQSKKYRLWCLHKLQKTWPALWDVRIDRISPQDCKDWAAKLSSDIASHYFNNVIGTLKLVVEAGIKSHKDKCGEKLENAALELKRVRVKQKNLKLPESSHFKELLKNLRLRSGGWGPRVADLVEFLTYGGMRIHSEAVWVTWEDIDWQRKEMVVRGNPDAGTKNSEIRRVPILPDMEALLLRLKDKVGGTGSGMLINSLTHVV